MTPEVDEGSAATLSGSLSDPGPLDSHTVLVNWGDGSAAQVINLAAGVNGFSADHVYVDDNPTGTPSDPYSVQVTLLDKDGGRSVANRALTVDNVAPVFGDLQLATQQSGLQRNVTLTGSYVDAGVQDTHTVSVDWGDGSTGTGVVDETRHTFSASHVFALTSPSQSFAVVTTLTDDDTGSRSATIQSKSTGVNNAPVAQNDSVSLDEDTSVAIAVLGNDTDLDGDPLTPQVVTGPAHGQLALLADNTYRYTPTANYNGPDSFTYQASDGKSTSNVATVSITVRPVNDAPTLAAVPNQSVNEGASVVVQLAAADVDGNALTYSVTGGNAKASASVDANGKLTLTGIDGDASVPLIVQVSDGTLTAQQSFVLTVANVAPTFGGLQVSPQVNEGSAALLAGTLVDPGTADSHTVSVNWGDGSTAQVIALAAGVTDFQASHVYADDNPTGTPSDPYSVQVTLLDKDGGSASATRGLTVSNVAPVVGSLQLATQQTGLQRDVVLTGVFSDVGALDTHTVAVTWGDGSSGTGVVDETGHTFTANHRFTLTSPSQTFSVTATVTDDDTGSGSKTIVSGSTGVNNPPVAQNDSVSLDEDTSVVIAVLGNDTDLDGDPLTPQVVTGPAHGQLALLADNTYRYTPTANYSGPDSFTYQASDGQATSNVATVAITVRPVNDAPTLAAVPNQSVNEGASVVVQLAAADVDGNALTYSVTGGNANLAASVDATGNLTLTGLDGNASVPLTVQVSDGTLTAQRGFVVTVNNVAPTLSVTGAPSVPGGTPYVVNLGHTDPGADTISQWSIDWGDGTTQRVAGNATQASHTYARSGGAFTVLAVATDEDGSYVAAPLRVQVGVDYLNVTRFTPNGSGFAVRFDHPFDPTTISLFDGGAGAPVDVVLRGATVGNVSGSLVFDADLQGLRFIRTGGILPFDTYTVTLASGPQNFHDATGPLDGNNDGVVTPSGDNAVFGFDFRSTGSGVLSLPDFMRGPGQSVDVPAAGKLLPVTFTSPGGMQSMVFTVGFDPALLAITGAQAGADLPAGASVQFALEPSASGGMQARITLTLPGNAVLAAGATRLVDLIANVPATAPYGKKEIIDLTVTQINGSVVAAGLAGAGPVDDDALHVVGYFGDTSGSADYSTLDSTLIQRYITKLDPGFAAWRNIDPLIVADVDGNGALSVLDMTKIQREIAFIAGVAGSSDQIEIPPIPRGIGPIVFGGPDPLVDLPRELIAQAGGTVSVPVRLSLGLDSVQLRLSFDADKFDLVGVRRGTLTQDFGWYISANQPGSVTVDMSRLQAMGEGSGTLLVLDLHVRADAPAGDAAIDLAYARLNDSWLTLGVQPQPGDDATDGRVRIVAPVASAPLLASSLPALRLGLLGDADAAGDGFGVLPVIRLDRPAAAALRPTANADAGGKTWLRDYLGTAGQPAKAAANAGLKVVLPRVSPVATPLDSRAA